MAAVRTVKVAKTVVNGAGVPQPGVTVTAQLIPAPGAGLLIDLNGEIVDLTPFSVKTDNSGTFTFDPAGTPASGLIAPGDLTPLGCQWRVTYLQTTLVSDSFAYTGATIDPAAWVPDTPKTGLIKMYVTLVEGNATPDQAGSFVFSPSQDAVWTGGAGTGQIISGLPMPPLLDDSSGSVYSYFVPNSQQTPNTTYYNGTTPAGTPFSFLSPPDYGAADRGAYAGGTTYAAGDISQRTGVPYISLQNANTGHTPESSPTWWAPFIGLAITAHLTSPIAASSLGGNIPPTYIAHSADVPVLPGDPEQTPATLSDDLENLAARVAFNAAMSRLYAADNLS